MDNQDIHVQIQELLKKGKMIASIWSIDDVLEDHPNLTKDEAWEILQTIDRKQDAEIGINWNVIQCFVENYLENRKKAA